ncbi:hypothetical protein [Blastococcus brunescens]|uniref:Uncharacterized protein n=1 Tax=Blastococcus brunescens TaxID=1564165 RepID=A0ABZ1B416_9ACTN|nr:hypothetical protein [Blastococcus sp. BMG 8361]WRL65531.1 hypothetical protein U6N30_08025 [Blastococcus sp. BMG 8361]
MTLGLLYVPVAGALEWTTPLVLVGLASGAALVARSLLAPRGAVIPLRGLRRLAGEVDVVGSTLAVVALGSLVWAFAAADPATEIVAHGPLLLPVALAAAVAFVWHERRTEEPVLPLQALRPVGAWGRCWSTSWWVPPWSRRWSTSRSSRVPRRRRGTSSARRSCCSGC